MINFVNNQAFRDDINQDDAAGLYLKSPTPLFQHVIKERKFLNSDKLLILGSDYGYDSIEAANEGITVKL